MFNLQVDVLEVNKGNGVVSMQLENGFELFQNLNSSFLLDSLNLMTQNIHHLRGGCEFTSRRDNEGEENLLQTQIIC